MLYAMAVIRLGAVGYQEGYDRVLQSSGRYGIIERVDVLRYRRIANFVC